MIAEPVHYLEADFGSLLLTAPESVSSLTAAPILSTTVNDDGASTTFSMFNNPSTSVVAGSEEGEEVSSHSGSRSADQTKKQKKEAVTLQTVSALSSKAHVFLRRAFQAAMCSIEKLFPSQVGFVRNEIVWILLNSVNY